MSDILRALGPAQRAMLHHLAAGDGTWHRADPWRVQANHGPSSTVRVLGSLEERGYVQHSTRRESGGSYTIWTITDAGREAVGMPAPH